TVCPRSYQTLPGQEIAQLGPRAAQPRADAPLAPAEALCYLPVRRGEEVAADEDVALRLAQRAEKAIQRLRQLGGLHARLDAVRRSDALRELVQAKRRLAAAALGALAPPQPAEADVPDYAPQVCAQRVRTFGRHGPPRGQV